MELIGRDAERRRLKAALANPEISLVVVLGASGAGKTALVDAALSDLSAQGVLVGCGKYAEGSGTSGFAPILRAISAVVGQALDLLYDPAAGADSLRTVLGEQFPLLQAAGLEGMDVPGTKAGISSVPLVGRAGGARIVDAISRLMSWLNGFAAPIVLFIDDWQRAPEEAHALTAIAMRLQSHRLCTIVLAQRSEVFNSVGSKQPHVDIIDIGPLARTDQITLLGAAVGDHAAGAAIAEWLGQSSSGLPFDLLEAARVALEQSAVSRHNDIWSFDPVRAAGVDRHDFTEAVVHRVRALPYDVLETGVACALWGDRTSLGQMAVVLQRSFTEIVEAARRLQRDGIILIVDGETTFVHDRMRAGLLVAPEPAMRSALAARMAERLLVLPMSERSLRTALQLRLAAGIERAVPASWRDLFAEGALNARNEADSVAATAFAEAAWALRERAPPVDRAADDLILREASLAAAAHRDLVALRRRVEEMIAHAHNQEQLGEAYEVGIVAASLADDRELAWTWAVEGLKRLGARFPVRARKLDLLLAVIHWRFAAFLPGRQRPRGRDAPIDPLSRLVHHASVIAYARDPLTMLVMSVRAVERAHRLGYQSAFWDSTTVMQYAAFGNPEKAAKIAAAVVKEPLPAFARAATLYRALYFGLIWTQPLATLRDGLDKIYDLAIAEGDLLYAGQAVRNAAQFAWRLEPTLAGVAAALNVAEEKAERLCDSVALQGMRAFTETVLALRDPRGFEDPGYDAPWTRLGVSAGAGAPIVWMEILGMSGDWPGILDLAKKYEAARPGLLPHPGGVIWCFHENLARLKLGFSPRRRDLRYIRKAARLNPADHQRKLLTLEAEVLRRDGAAEACLQTCARAVEIAAAGTSRLEAGIAAECAAAAARSFGRMEMAVHYDTVARATWNAWGALAKTGGAPVESSKDTPEVQARLMEAESKAATALRSERAKSRFLAEVSHELRTPLQGMQGLLDLAAEGPSSVELTDFREVFTSLKTVVDDLTDLSALGAGAPLNPKPANIVDVVESECRVGAAAAKRKGLTFTSQIAAEVPWLAIDAPRVRQIIRNLLSNAVKYTDRGDVGLHLSVIAGERAHSARVSISVEDSGPGLRDMDLPRLFEPFERGERNDDKGLGLGLAVSRRIAERMGGTLTAENRRKGGARFSFAFETDQANQEPETNRLAAPLQILLVEDVPLSRRVIAVMLGRYGHTVREASDGAEALALWSERTFDLIVLDLGLPDMDGLALLQRIGLGSRNAPTPVIVLTASTSSATSERACNMGAALVLHKPVSGEDLRDAIQSVFAGQRRDEPRLSALFGAEMEVLTREANAEILARGRSLIAEPGTTPVTAREAHRLAGLAAQFGAAEVAAAADRLEAELLIGATVPVALAALEAALTRFASRQHVSPASPGP